MAALSKGFISLMDEALSHCQMGDRDDLGRTAWHRAIDGRDPEGALLALWGKQAQSPTVFLADYSGRTPLMATIELATEVGDRLGLMLAQKGSLDAQNQAGESALIIAARLSRTNVVKGLLELGARIDLTDRQSMTALHWALTPKGCEDCALMLCDPSLARARDIFGATPLIRASALGFHSAVAELTRFGALEEVEARGLDALAIAMESNESGSVQILKAAKERMDLDDGVRPMTVPRNSKRM